MIIALISYSKKRGYTAQYIHNVKNVEHVEKDICKAILYDGSRRVFTTRSLVDIQLIKDGNEGIANA